MNPCGRIVDAIRSCYSCDMAFYRDKPEKLTRVSWYFVETEKEYVPFAHPFGQRIWDKRNGEPEPPLGERYAKRTYRKGDRLFNQKGVGLCGTEEQWNNGPLSTDEVPRTWPDSNVPRCCPKPIPLPDPFALNACCCPGCCDDCGCCGA